VSHAGHTADSQWTQHKSQRRYGEQELQPSDQTNSPTGQFERSISRPFEYAKSMLYSGSAKTGFSPDIPAMTAAI
jgi:hypothetical protein